MILPHRFELGDAIQRAEWCQGMEVAVKKMMLWIIAVATLSGSTLCAQDIAGDWQGTLKAGAGLRLILHITKSDNGGWSAMLYSIDQGPDGIAVSSCASRSALGFGLAAAVPTPGDAPAKEHRQGGHGPKTRGSDVLDVAEQLGICRVGQVRFARGTARYQAWRELERRPLDWASRSFARGSLH